MKTLENNNLDNKNILVRVDLNVPVVNEVITERSRIKSILPTLKKLKNSNNKIFLISHFGRPKGIKNNQYSLKFICSALKEEMNLEKIYFLNDFDEANIKMMINKINPGDICLFENIRFYEEEENNDLNFAKKISKNFDAFVNDAFSCSHRNHASITSLPIFLPSYMGYSFAKEIDNLNTLLSNKDKPNLAIIGGAKISTKIELLLNLSQHFDTIVIGGAMANTFLYANKINIGNSLIEKNYNEVVFSIIEQAKVNNCKIILPIDVVCANNFNEKESIRRCNVENIFDSQMILDIGPKTTQLIEEYINKSKLILWNGPLGVIEQRPFEKSSVEIANIIKLHLANNKAISIAGGGDTNSVIKIAKAKEGFSYISNAGGAFLEWLEGNGSPGYSALKNNNIN